MLQTVFEAVVKMSITASVAILVVLAVRLILHRAPHVLSYALWAVVLFRLLCPVAFPSPLSLFELLPEQVSVSPTVPNPLDFMVPSETPPQPSVISPAPASQAEQNVSDFVPPEVPTPSPQKRFSPMAWLWLAGVLVLATGSGVSYLRLRRSLVGAAHLKDNVWLADHIPSPFVLGFVRPRIYLPSTLGQEERRYILLHEQHHIRRGDPLWKLLGFAALCLHWFNPLVWAAFLLAGRDMEMSCDEAVIRKLGPDVRADYSASLLSLATGRRIVAGTPLAFGEGDPKGRIKNLARWKRPAFWVVLIFVVLVLAVILLVGTDPLHQNNSEAALSDSLTFHEATPGTTQNITVARAALAQQRELRLVLLNGTHETSDSPDPSGGRYAESYRGSYALQVWQGKTLLSQLGGNDLQYLSSDGTTLNFPVGLSLSLADYDQDGLTDFALGQPCGNVQTLYRLFSVDVDGILSVKPFQGQLVAAGNELSPLFETNANGDLLYQQMNSGDFVTYTASLHEGQYNVLENLQWPQQLLQDIQNDVSRIQNTLTLDAKGLVSLQFPNTAFLGGKVYQVPGFGPVGPRNLALRIELLGRFYTNEGVHDTQELLKLLLPLKQAAQGLPGVENGRFQQQLELQRGRFEGLELYIGFAYLSDPSKLSYFNIDGGYLNVSSQEYQPGQNYQYNPAARHEPDAAIESGDVTRLLYTFADGSTSTLSLRLPQGITLEAQTEPNDYELPPDMTLKKNGQPIGSLTLIPLATTLPEELQAVNPAAQELPMQIFATVALANHAGYQEYTPARSWPTGAAATATYWWQDLAANPELPAAQVPEQSIPCVLVYDWQLMPCFVQIMLEENALSSDQITALAESLRLA